MGIHEALQFWSAWYSQNAKAWETRFAHRRQPIYREVVRRAQIRPGSRVLDIGTGTGGAAIEALAAVGSDGYVVGIDNAEGMLRIAQEKAVRLAARNVEFRLLDMSNLEFPEGSFDSVISSFAIYAAFPPGIGVREAHRVLRKGGKLTFCMFGKGVGGSELAPQLYGAVFTKYLSKQPSDLLRKAREFADFTYLGFMRYGPLAEPADPSAVLGFMRSVGFKNLEASVIHHRSVFPSIEAYVEDRVAVYSPLEYTEMAEADKRAFMEECQAALKPLMTDEGMVSEVEVLFFSGTRT